MVIAISDYAPSIIRDYVHNSKKSTIGRSAAVKVDIQ